MALDRFSTASRTSVVEGPHPHHDLDISPSGRHVDGLAPAAGVAIPFPISQCCWRNTLRLS